MGNRCQDKGAGGASWSQDPWGQDQHLHHRSSESSLGPGEFSLQAQSEAHKQWRLSLTGFDRCRRGTVKMKRAGEGMAGVLQAEGLGAKAPRPETSHGAPRERGTVTRTRDGVWGWHQLPAHSDGKSPGHSYGKLARMPVRRANWGQENPAAICPTGPPPLPPTPWVSNPLAYL